jgi:Pacifastin inhibitor (LCMII)
MTYSNISFLRSSLSLSFAGLLVGLLASACDLPDKNLGDDDTAAGSTTGGMCEPGDTMMQDCNTCSCTEDGQWACTEIGCDPTSSSGADSGGACDPTTKPEDDCNSCSCIDGEWACTAIGCDPTTGGSDSGGGVCDPAENPTDGCNDCVCNDGQWSCTEAECPPVPPVGICGGAEPNDPIEVTNATIVGHALIVSVEHGGGCVNHGYGSCWDGAFAESEPVQAWLQINHEDHDDPCDAIVMQDVSFDLTPMRDAWIDAYQQPSGTIVVHVADWGSVEYTF